MRDLLLRVWTDLGDRVGGPMTFRIILQPLMATLLATVAGVKDANEGRPPYFWTILTDPSQRQTLIQQGWKAVGRIFILAVVMDVIYQWIVSRWVYPFEVLIVAIVLAVIPYLLTRGPVNRLVQFLRRRRKSNG
jgi:hypothetical protein